MRYFTWDKNKAKANIKKHGIRFETASLVFDDPFLVRDVDQIIDNEIRWHAIGMVDGHMLLLVVHTSREDEEDEYVRIISARKATPHEERRYVSGIRELGHLQG